MPFNANPKTVKAEDLWKAIHELHAAQVAAGTGEFLNPALIPKINAIRSAVLNRLSHSGASSLTSTELKMALDTIKELRHAKIPFKA